MAEITPYNLVATPSVAAPNDEIIFTWKWDPTPQHETESITGFRGYLFQRLDPYGNVVYSTRTAASLTNPQIKQAFPGYSVDPYYWEYRVYATQWQWGGASGGSAEDEPLLGGPSNVVRVYDSRMQTVPPSPESITVGDYVKDQPLPISWSPVSFPEEIKYMLQYSHDGGGWFTAYDGTETSYTVPAIASSVNTVQYRVQTYVKSDNSRRSDWTVSEVKTAQTSTGTSNTALYFGVDNIARKVKGIYVGVDGKARNVKKGYIGVNGVARLFYDASPYGELGEWIATTMPVSSFWYGIAYGDGKFVSFTNGDSKAAYSFDGINWISLTLPTTDVWGYATYGDGKFVVVATGNGGSNKAMYSINGIDWTVTDMPLKAPWYNVTYGNGKFVAIANGGKVAFSVNGINWTDYITVSEFNRYSKAVYGNDKFVAVVGGNTNKAAYSTDGINWIFTTMPSTAYWTDVTYGNGRFVAVASGNTKKAAYSTDGINWTSATLPSSGYWSGVTYGNGKFVAVAATSDKSAYSFDGINWIATVLPYSDYWGSITYGDGKFVAVMNGGARSIHSAYAIG